ncbi:2TM domain-containing protein [Marinirhabdus gelatinilytica]|uniref:2TM domain-containing protein n=1 Tax=Marinirhabdus gelatinilytica TaxID=1703343 RepID=A0A370QFK7_9FLAO|nr:2TM domain-containing protein [Marinirhabdus gelatinilytica]RDK87141.1 2TM domain-containing protein [Marinirhabdus gelatinilytica]
MKTKTTTPYERAQKKVSAIKNFYKHLRAYLIINVFLLLLRAKIFRVFEDGNLSDVHFERWLDLNTYGTSIVWGVALLIHGLYAFQYKFNFLKKWEARKLNEILEKDELE